MERRKDNKGRVLKEGESQRKDGLYQYRWTDKFGKRRTIYSGDLKELRARIESLTESEIQGIDPIANSMTVKELVKKYSDLHKPSLKETTTKNTDTFMKILSGCTFANKTIASITPTEAKVFMKELYDKGYCYGTINNYKGILRPAFELACDDKILSRNPFSFQLSKVVPKENKTKTILSNEQFSSLVDFCKKHHILLISDAAYVDMYFKPELKPMSILEIEGAKDIAVEFFSFSKPYAITGWRLGWICGNSEAVKIFGKLKSTLDSGLFKALQKACAEILNSQEGEEYIKEANERFKRNQEIFVKGLREELGWGDFNIPDATFYLWLPIPPRYKSSVEFTDELMYKSGVIAVPGDAFGDNGKGFFRASIVCSEDELKEVIKRMKEDGFHF